MHFNTKLGMVTLGGNTVFFKTNQLRANGGWDDKCLTEDAEIGIRMSVRGAKIIATYDPKHITKEETPASISDFIKQRTRWNQGFIQVLLKGEWKKYDTFSKRAFSFYTLSFPFTQSLLTMATIFCIALGIEIKMPLFLSLISFLPLMILLLQISTNCVGLYEFCKEQHLKLKWRILIFMVITFLAYQLLLSIGAIRATYRHLKGTYDWEKTTHLGQHRIQLSNYEVIKEAS